MQQPCHVQRRAYHSVLPTFQLFLSLVITQLCDFPDAGDEGQTEVLRAAFPQHLEEEYEYFPIKWGGFSEIPPLDEELRQLMAVSGGRVTIL